MSQGGKSSATRGNKGVATRVPLSVEVRIVGETREYSAQTVDLSRTGVLLWIGDESFAGSRERDNIVAYSERLADEFSRRLEVVFADGALRRDAEVARVVRKGDEETGPVCVACRFANELTSDEVARIRALPDARPRQERRNSPRVEQLWMVEVSGGETQFRAYAFNLSHEGMLLTISDADFAPPARHGQLAAFSRRLGVHFPRGLTVRFLDSRVKAEADIVRVDEREQGGELAFVLACQFRRPFGAEESSLLGLDPDRAPPPPPAAAEVAVEDSELSIRSLLEQAFSVGATDLHVKAGAPPRMRIHGTLLDSGRGVITSEMARALALELMSPAQSEIFEREGDMELGYALEDGSRFRVNVLRQRGETGLAIRCIPADVPSIESLGLAACAVELAQRPRGLVLVTGPTGSGKSTTLAAMVDHVNRTRACHVITMEDPIEYLHADKEAHITQREIGRDAMDYAVCLKRALRQDPDVILVGEMRDLETTSQALTAAETGHLVFATMHTTSAALTPGRIVDIFPSTQQNQIRLQLADCLQGIMAQMLLPRADGNGLVLVQETLIATDAVRALIRENKTPQILNIMQTGARDGMRTLESALNELVANRTITFETAVTKANVPKQIRPRS